MHRRPGTCHRLDGPNPEYPWPQSSPTDTPCEHAFTAWADLQETSRGRQFIDLMQRLIDSAEAFL
jgi:hypothetical protein